MKAFYLLLFGLFAFPKFSDAQVNGFAVNGLSLGPNVVTTSCDSTLSIGFSAVNSVSNSTSFFDLPYVITGNNFNGFQFQAVVNWGDGVTSNSGGGTSTTGTNISMNPPLNHTYSSAGTYTVITSVYNPANQTYAFDSIQYTVGSCNYQLYAFVGLDCDNNGTIEQNIPNAPFQLIGSNSQVYQDSSQNNMLLFTNLQSGSYTLQINPQWLIANGYQVQSSFPNNTINIPSPGATTYSFTLICNQALTQLCVGGTIFCDANQNGIFELNESTLNNVPVEINGLTTYSNAVGQYNISFAGVAGQYYPLQINSNYLANSLNTVSVNTPDSVLAYPCAIAAPPFPTNIAFNCNSQSPTLCYEGYVFCDANANGVMNAGEQPLTYAPVTLYNNTATNSSVTVYTDSTGYFSYCGQYSTSTYLFATISQNWLIYNGYNPIVGVITLVGSTSATANTGYLAVNCGGTTTTCSDVWTTVSPWIGYYQNNIAYIKLNWGSYGPSPVGAYTLSFTYPAGVSPILSSIQNSNYTISGNTITWDLTNNATSFTNYDVIQFSVPGGLINGAQHFYISTIAPTGPVNDCGTYNNNGSLLQILGNAYDPNDKNASTDYMNENYPLGFLDAFIDDALTYTIRFQNTGTAPAQNIYIIDTLSSLLDWTSFTLIEASHPMQVVNLGNGILRFEFDQIWLPDSTSNEPESHGQLTYRVRELTNNAIMSTIKNTAFIYFDWNDPIITNTTFHQNMWLDSLGEIQQELKIYPNPAQTQIQLDLQEPTTILIKNMNGKIIFNDVITSGQSIDIQGFESGMYFIEGAALKGKFVKL